jgi:peptidoglycan/LPS O-acetylase OafA/YrhL
MKKLEHLQVLRGIAATMVVLFHAQGMCPAYAGAQSISGMLMGRSGGYGVDLFFVLSGFIIRYAEPDAGYEPWAFIRKRVARIVPVYWLLSLAVLGLRWVVPQLHNSAPPSTSFVLKSLFFVSFTEGTQPIVFVGWSLEYEMLFYLAAFALLAIGRAPWKWLVIAFSMCGAAGALLAVSMTSPASHFFFNPIILEFALGVQLASYVRTNRVDLVSSAVLAAALLIVGWVNRASWGGQVIVAGVPAAVLVGVFARLDQRGTSRAPSFLVRMGDASYSTYLLQVFLLSAAGKVAKRVFGTANPDVLVVVVTAFTIGAGLLFYRWVEHPVTRRIGAWISRPSAEAVRLA